MKASLCHLFTALVASGCTAFVTTLPAQAGSLRLNGTVIDNLGNPVSDANAITRFVLGTTQYPPIGDYTFKATTDTSGAFSAFTSVSPNYTFVQLGSPSASVLIEPTTDSSINFLSEQFAVANFRSDGNFNYVADATLRVTSVPEPSSALATLALGALGAGALWKRRHQSGIKAE